MRSRRIDPVVVVPIYKADLSSYELMSLRHARHHLSRHRLVAIAPEGLDVSRFGLEAVSFEPACFTDKLGYNRLMLSERFYERFADHSHILICQLDALVLRDELEAWCAKDFDYIGASWYPDKITAYEGFAWPYAPVGCGNGGFSLRRTDAFLTHLRARRSNLATVVAKAASGDWRAVRLLTRYWRHVDPRRYRPHESLNEDVYWGIFAPIFQPEFRVASPADGDLFSFEYDPKWLFDKTCGHVPFGCHAWFKFADSRAFWDPYLLAD